MKTLTLHLKLFLLALLLLPLSLIGQEEIDVHLGLSLPSGNFGDTDLDDDNAGLAGTGLDMGIQFVWPISDKGFGIFGGLDILYNPFAKKAKDQIKEGEDNSTFTFPKYISIPITAGARYKYTLHSGTALLGKLGIALTPTKLTNFVWKETGDDDYIEKYKMAFGIGLVLGLGVEFNDKFDVMFHYMALGKHTFKGTFEYGPDKGDTDEFNQNINPITLTVGFRLK